MLTSKSNCGSRIAVVGPTGSGKTLLMRALANLDSIDAGKILWRSETIQGNAIPHFRQQAIYLQQRATLIDGTVEENLRLPFTFRSHHQREYSRQTILPLLAQVNRTESFLDRSSRELSGGEAQIVALIRAVQLEPSLLLLYEPTAALDEESTLMVEELIDRWFAELPTKRAFVWVSHNKEQVASVANQVVTMNQGQLTGEVNQSREQLP
jgi:putative ABC transport system ATP-binding protein